MFDAGTTSHDDLRGGTAPWRTGFDLRRENIDGDFRCDVLVVGAGITGSLVSEHLTSLGHQVCILDREKPGFGSTAASTAMLQWEIDCSLSELADFYGFDRAAELYRQSLRAVAGLRDLVTTLGLDCAFRERSSLYLAGGDTGGGELAAEHQLRARAGIPGVFLDYLPLKREFGFDRPAAILSPGSADADPLQLSHALLARATAMGARIFDAEARVFDPTGRTVFVTTDRGHVVEARHVVLATGYVMPDFVKTPLHKTASSWAVATPPQVPSRLWRQGVLLWEAAQPYLYARTTVDHRIIIGGEDDDSVVDPDQRDRLMQAKAKTILSKLGQLWPDADATAEFVWSGAFGGTVDGLPLIGQVPGYPSVYAAYGYGGNGITFGFLASRMIACLLEGDRQPWFNEYAIDRPVPDT